MFTKKRRIRAPLVAPYAPASTCTSSLLERGLRLRPCSSIERKLVVPSVQPGTKSGHRAAQERFDALAVSAQDPLDAVLDVGRGFEAWNRIGFRVIADVLNLKLTRQTARA